MKRVRKFLSRPVFFAATALVLFTLAAELYAQSTVDAYGKLAKLGAEQRRQALIEGSKKEGGLMIYSTIAQPDMQALVASAEKKYPFMKVQVFREGRGAALADRALAEARAGKHIADLVVGASSGLFPMMKAGVLARYRSPELANYDKEFFDPQGQWATAFLFEWLFAYNTNFVEARALPANYLSLLDPYWKGKLVMDPLPNSFIKGALKVYGEAKALDLFKRLVDEQGVQFRRGRTMQMQLLAAGEFPAAVEIIIAHIKRLKTQGAPVNYHYVYPTPLTVSPVSILKSAPHPYAAALFVDHLLSLEGQTVMAGAGYSVAQKKVDVVEEKARKARVVISPEWDAEVGDKVIKIAKEYFAQSARTTGR
jgi:iron(III) transport system substrate-binding protein